jgi:hypothetical protein
VREPTCTLDLAILEVALPAVREDEALETAVLAVREEPALESLVPLRRRISRMVSNVSR